MEDTDRDLPIIDAHHHLWDLSSGHYPWLTPGWTEPFRYGDTSPLRRNYLWEDYLADTRAHRIVKTVHMEAEWTPDDPVGETRWLNQAAQGRPFPNALVAQAWLDRDDVETVLQAQAAFPLVRGIRQKPKATASADEYRPSLPGSLADPRFRAGYSLLGELGFSYDVQTPYWHLRDVADLAAAFPETQIIIDHAGLPADRSEKGLAAWRDAIRIVAGVPNIAIKISGIGQPGRLWTVEANKPIIMHVIEQFGPDRSMFASNFPVDSLCADFDTIYSGFKAITAGIDQGIRRKLFHDTAARIYRL